MKIVLEYDGTNLIDNNGTMIACWSGLEDHELQESQTDNVETLVKLRNAGFSTDEIIELRRKELI